MMNEARKMIATGKYNHVVFKIGERDVLLTFTDENDWDRFVKEHSKNYIGAYHKRV